MMSKQTIQTIPAEFFLYVYDRHFFHILFLMFCYYMGHHMGKIFLSVDPWPRREYEPLVCVHYFWKGDQKFPKMYIKPTTRYVIFLIHHTHTNLRFKFDPHITNLLP